MKLYDDEQYGCHLIVFLLNESVRFAKVKGFV
jgi:hypothetical protein